MLDTPGKQDWTTIGKQEIGSSASRVHFFARKETLFYDHVDFSMSGQGVTFYENVHCSSILVVIFARLDHTGKSTLRHERTEGNREQCTSPKGRVLEFLRSSATNATQRGENVGA